MKVKPALPYNSVVRSVSGQSGHANGVIIPSKNGNTFLTARHLGTPIGTKVFVTLDNGEQFVSTVISKTTPDLRVSKLPLAQEPRLDRYWYGDIAICTIDGVFPVNPPPIGKILSGNIWAVHKDGSASSHLVGVEKRWGVLGDQKNWLRTKWGEENFSLGDSGLPWFKYNLKMNKWETVGITSRVAINSTQTPWSAESPRLFSDLFYSSFFV